MDPPRLALLVQSSLCSLIGVLLIGFPGFSDLLFDDSATRSSIYAARYYNTLVGAFLVYLAAVLCAIKPTGPVCRSIAAGASCVAVTCGWLLTVPTETAHLRQGFVAALIAYFSLVAVVMAFFAPPSSTRARESAPAVERQLELKRSPEGDTTKGANKVSTSSARGNRAKLA
jgi:hypothetical protein